MQLLSSWQKAPDRPALGDDELHVWRIDLDGDDPQKTIAARSVLDKDELQRADRLVSDQARIRFTLAHSALRKILSRYLFIPPHEIAFHPGPHGKPFLVDHKLKFNLSHSGAMALVAVIKKAEVGIDIELINERHATDDIAKRFFSPAEQTAYFAYPPAERLHVFFRCWSRKEAVIKALGEGLSCPLDSFDVSLDVQHAQLLAMRREMSASIPWNMLVIEPHPDYTAAAAIIGKLNRTKGFDYADCLLNH